MNTVNAATVLTEQAVEYGRQGGLKRAENYRVLLATKGEAEVYREKRLARVRKLLDRIDKLAMEETDPKRSNELAGAALRWSEQERKLAGRPDPGSYRPSSPPKKAKSQGGEVE